MITEWMDKKVRRFNNNAGLTMIEVLVSLMILGIIMIGLHQVLGTALSAYDQTTSKQELLAQARYAMARLVMFVQETDEIDDPTVGQQVEPAERQTNGSIDLMAW